MWCGYSHSPTPCRLSSSTPRGLPFCSARRAWRQAAGVEIGGVEIGDGLIYVDPREISAVGFAAVPDGVNAERVGVLFGEADAVIAHA